MNNVNSISQMNSMVCEHSSLIGPDVKKGPIIGEQGPDGNEQQSQNKFLLRRLLTLLLILQVTAKNIPYFHPMTAVLPRRGHDLHRVFDQPRSCLSIPMVGGLIILPTVLCLPRTTIVLMAPTDLKAHNHRRSRQRRRLITAGALKGCTNLVSVLIESEQNIICNSCLIFRKNMHEEPPGKKIFILSFYIYPKMITPSPLSLKFSILLF